MSTEMSILNLSWPWNPNHKYRFYATGPGIGSRWLFTIRFSNVDQSIYVIPLYEREYIVQSTGDGARTSFRHRPGTDFHLSLHESGVVNLTTGEATARLRKELSDKGEVRHIVTFQINATDNLPIATLEEINNPKGGHLPMAIVGFPTAPLMLTVYCAKETAEWSPRSLGNTMMIHYKTLMRGKDYNFHFVQWQHLAMPKGEGDLGIQFGGEDDSFYGV